GGPRAASSRGTRRPERGPGFPDARRRSCPHQLAELVLFQAADAELLGARELGARILADDDVVGLLADARDHPAAERLDAPLGLGARHAREAARQHELL